MVEKSKTSIDAPVSVQSGARVSSPILNGRWAAVATAFLALFGTVMALNGVAKLLAPNYPGDLFLRWHEERSMLRGIDPYDLSALNPDYRPSVSESARIEQHHLRSTDSSEPSGYPPWSFTESLLFIYPIPLRADQVLFAIWSMSALVFTLCWIYRFILPFGRGAAWFVTAGALAVNGNSGTLRLGQYGLLLNAFLLLAISAQFRRKPVSSGLAMAIAAMKPNYSFLQFFIWLLYRRWMVLLTVAVVCMLASLLPWCLTGVNPVEMLMQMLHQAAGTAQNDTSLLRVAAGVMPFSVASMSLGLLGVLGTVMLGWPLRKASPVVGLSIASVIGRVSLYHRQYDNTMLVIPLAVLAWIAVQKNQRLIWISFAIFGLSVWAPLRYSDYTPLTVSLLSICWFLGLGVICRYGGLVTPIAGDHRGLL
jgi:hypothetical protein